MQQLEQEARTLCERGDFDAALELCNQELTRSPQLPFAVLLRKNIIERRRQAVLEMIRQVDTQLKGDRNLEHRLRILRTALDHYPNEAQLKTRFDEAFRAMDAAQSKISQARSTANDGLFEEARAILDGIEGLDPEFAGLSAERQRISQLQEKAKLSQRKSRCMADIRAALNHRNFERGRNLLSQALLEFPDDTELAGLQERCAQLEDMSIRAGRLLNDACSQIQAGNYELGIETLQNAGRLDPDNRQIQSAHFDALIQFARNIGEEQPKRAKYLLERAARISPYNLLLESTTKYISDRIRQRAINDCIAKVHNLRQSYELEQALKLVEEVEAHLKLYSDPVLEQLRTSINEDLGYVDESGNFKISDDTHAAVEESWHSAVQPTTRISALRDFLNGLDLTNRSRTSIAKLDNYLLPIVGRANGAVSFAMKESRPLMERAKRTFSALPLKVLKVMVGCGAAVLLVIFATVIIGRSSGPQPELTSIGKGTMLMPAVLHEDADDSSRQAGTLSAGEPVNLLTELPAMSLDAWVRIRPAANTTSTGWVRLRDLDSINTDDPGFDLWHAMTFLDRAGTPEDFRYRVGVVDKALKTEPLLPSRDTDRIYLTVSKAFARVARESMTQPDIARIAIDNADGYLSHITGALILTEEADDLKATVTLLRDAISKTTAESKLAQSHP